MRSFNVVRCFNHYLEMVVETITARNHKRGVAYARPKTLDTKPQHFLNTHSIALMYNPVPFIKLAGAASHLWTGARGRVLRDSVGGQFCGCFSHAETLTIKAATRSWLWRADNSRGRSGAT